VSVTVAPPAAPTGLTATTASSPEIDLAWTNTDPMLSVVVQRSPIGADTWTTLATLPPDSPGFYIDADAALVPKQVRLSPKF
jgi:hypothetical protein